MKVYAVEASSIAVHASKLVAANKVDDVIKVLSGKIEEIQLPEQVDVIISEPMGYMLLNERMLETFLHAKKFLKPGGKNLMNLIHTVCNFHSIKVKCFHQEEIFTLPPSLTRLCIWNSLTRSTFGIRSTSMVSIYLL